MIGYFEQFTDDVETLYSDTAGSGWDFERLQLSPGPLGSWISIAHLPDISIHWYRIAASVRAVESHQHDAVFLAFLLSAGGRAVWRGREVDPNQAMLYHPGQEQDYVLPRNIRSLGLMIGDRLLRNRGWRLRREPLLTVPAKAMGTVTRCCAAVTRCIARAPVLDPKGALVLQERLASRLEDLIAPWTEGTGATVAQPLSAYSSYHVIRRAEQLMRRWDPGVKFNARHLAEQAGVSSRTMYRAFHDCLGTGPYEFYQLLMLREFRRLVLLHKPEPGLITHIATDLGFRHLGRFSALYRRHYQELPRDTLSRWKMAPRIITPSTYR